MNRIIISLLILCCTSSEVRISVATKSQERHAKHHLSNAAVASSIIKATPDDSKKYLDDYSLTIPMQIGQESIESTIDTTSYVSWVLSQSPDNSRCENCPINAQLFKCGGSCQIQKDPTTKQNLLLTKETTYGGRAQPTGLYATEETVTLMNLKGKKVGFGLINKFSAESNGITKQGVFGLAYGQDYIDYEKKLNAQVGVVEPDISLQPENSVLQQFHHQLTNMPTATFALKLEDNLQLLIVGEQQNYFAQSKFTKFTNVGKRVWALNINKASFGKEGQFQATGTGVFDTTTKFIWTDKQTIDKFIVEVNKFNMDCVQSPDGLPKCTCNDDEHYNKFQDIYFSFNLNDKEQYSISKSDYIYREEKNCYILMKEIPASNTLLTQIDKKPILIIPYTFFKQNFVLFDLDNNTMDIAYAYNVNPDPLHLQNNTLLWVSIVGSVLLLVSLFFLINCMHKAPYDPDYMHFANAGQAANTQVVQQPPQAQSPPYQQQQIGSQYGVPQSYQLPQQRAQPPAYQGPGMFNTSPYRQSQVNPVAAQPGQFRQ